MRRAPLVVLCTAQLMVLLDGTIVNIALPAIGADLRLSADATTWLMTSYYLAFGGLLLLGGRAGDLLGRRRVFLAGLAVFSVASALGGFAATPGLLIAARVAQGLGAAAAAPSILALISVTYTDPRTRGRAMAAYAAMSSVGAATGLVAGGLLTEWLSWRWVLFVNVPLGIAVLVAGARVLRETPRGSGSFDLPGAATVTAALVCLVYGLSSVPAHGWTGGTAPLAFLAAAVFGGLFLAVERRSDRPLLPLAMLADRTTAVGLTAVAAVGATLFVLFFFGSQFAQTVRHTGPALTGLQYLPFSATLLVTAQVVARLAGRVPAARLVPAGGVLAALALARLTTLHPDST